MRDSQGPSLTVVDPWGGRRRPLWTVGLVAVLVVLAVVGAAWACWSGQLAVGATLTAAAWYIAHIAGLILLFGRRSRRRWPAQRGHVDGLTFRYSTRAYYWLVSVLAGTILGLAGLAVPRAIAARSDVKRFLKTLQDLAWLHVRPR